MEFITAFFNPEYMPQVASSLSLPGILWLTVGADALIALSYFSITIALLIFIRKRPDLEFRKVVVLFAAFILLCGITHLFSISTVWHGTYGVMALLKALTAIVSFITAVMVFRFIKPVLNIPSPEQYAQEQESTGSGLQARIDSFIRAAIEFVPAGVLIVNKEGELVYVNSEAERLFGYEDDELIGQSIETLILDIDHSKHAEQVMDFFEHATRRAMARGRIVQGRAKNGDPVAVEVSLMPQVVDGEQVVFASIIGVNKVVDLGEGVVTHATRLMRAINAADEGIWEWNIQSGDVWYSPRLLELIGLDPLSQKYTIDDWLGHIHPDDKAKVSGVLQEHFEKRSPYKVEYRGRNASGEYEWMQTRGEARFNRNNEPMFMSGTLVSVAETVELSDQLEEQVAINEELSKDFINTFEMAAVGIAHVSLDGNWLRVNQRLCEIVGYTEGELLTMTFQDITHPDDLKGDLNQLQRLIDGEGDSYTMEKRYIHKDGHIVWIHLTVSIVRSENSETGEREPQYFISVIEDISKRKTIERELANSNAELERFAFAASHDLQEPLRKIIMFSDSLQERLSNILQDEEAQYELERIGDAAARMKAMVAALMELSRAQRLEVKTERMTLKGIVDEVSEQLETLIYESGTEVVQAGASLDFMADRAAMMHVFQNLIINAIRYCPAERKPKVVITAEDVGRQVDIRFTDNGSGIPKNMQEAIFEPFRRLVGKHITGSGMGLSICRRIVERHGGSLAVERSNESGTTFLLSIPKN